MGIDAPPDKSVRKITTREAAHIAFLVEQFEEKDAAFLYSFAQALNLQAHRNRAGETKGPNKNAARGEAR